MGGSRGGGNGFRNGGDSKEVVQAGQEGTAGAVDSAAGVVTVAVQVALDQEAV